MASLGFEKLDVYRLSEKLADKIWKLVLSWNGFARDTVGKQLVRAADSICANIAEGCGRYPYADNKRFVRIARGSLYETHNWLRRAYRRELISTEGARDLTPLLQELRPRLNAYLKSIGPTNDE
jgi:four helix bundle protein